METTKKNDFVEIEFTGKANDEIFDTTNREQAKEMGLNADVKPVILSIGNRMVIPGFDDALEEKEIGKKYNIHLAPEKGFGARNPSLIKTIPIKIFQQQNMNPVPGMTVQLDSNIAKIISVSGGRVMVDFNNPLAGKGIDYEFKIIRKVFDDREKINGMQDFFFRQRFEFEIEEKTNSREDTSKKLLGVLDNNKRVIFKDNKIKPLIELFKEKFMEISGFDIEVKEEKEVKQEDKEQEKTESELTKQEKTKIEEKNKDSGKSNVL